MEASTAERAETDAPEQGDVDAREIQALYEQAEAIRADNTYDGTMHADLLRKLEPLLYMPLPERFIVHTPKATRKDERGRLQGLPYDQTGIKSAQVQIDRLNAILGQNHYRILTRYMQQGTICKAVIVVGNDLHWCRLDEQGDLVPFMIVGAETTDRAKYAEVLTVKEGMGGWSRGSNAGDTWKGAETNALKRLIARLGPGHEVYSQDFEDDPEVPHYTPPQEQVQKAVTEQVQPQLSPEEADDKIGNLLEEEHELQELRQQVNKAMLDLPTPLGPVERWTLMEPRANDQRQLAELLVRAQNAMGS